MNNVKTKIETYLFIKGYSFFLSTCCEKNAEITPKITFYFCVKGDFLNAAQSDSIDKSLDYHRFSLHIKGILRTFVSCKKTFLTTQEKEKILNFSSLIHNCHLELDIICHKKIHLKYFLIQNISFKEKL